MKWVYILWPAFITAVFGEMVFFPFIDPQELYLLGQPVFWSPVAVYSTGFLMLWALTSLTSWLCYFFQKPLLEAEHREKEEREKHDSDHYPPPTPAH